MVACSEPQPTWAKATRTLFTNQQLLLTLPSKQYLKQGRDLTISHSAVHILCDQIEQALDLTPLFLPRLSIRGRNYREAGHEVQGKRLRKHQWFLGDSLKH